MTRQSTTRRRQASRESQDRPRTARWRRPAPAACSLGRRQSSPSRRSTNHSGIPPVAKRDSWHTGGRRLESHQAEGLRPQARNDEGIRSCQHPGAPRGVQPTGKLEGDVRTGLTDPLGLGLERASAAPSPPTVSRTGRPRRRDAIGMAPIRRSTPFSGSRRPRNSSSQAAWTLRVGSGPVGAFTNGGTTCTRSGGSPWRSSSPACTRRA